MNIQNAETAEQIARCFPVMQELRPHLDEAAFIAQVNRQLKNDQYSLAFIEDNGSVVSAAGYRMIEMLAFGKAIYVDDLVTLESHQGKGFGSRMLDWLIEEAIRLECDQFHLDSGVQRFGAHRFYLHKGMDIIAHHFALKLDR